MWFSRAAMEVLRDDLRKIRTDQEEVLRALERVEKIIDHVARFYSHPVKGDIHIPPPLEEPSK